MGFSLGNQLMPDLPAMKSLPSSAAKVILGGTPLLGTLTGIGNYTRQLASALVRCQLVSDLKLFGDIGFLNISLLDRLNEGSGRREPYFSKPPQLRSMHAVQRAIRQAAVRSYGITAFYSVVSDWMAARQLSPYAYSYLYHSPNFILPKYEGPKLVTVHDLSIIKYPEFHRRQMVELCERGIRRAVDEGSHMVTVSALVKRELQAEFGLPDDRVHSVHHAPDQRCRPRNEAECVDELDRLGLKYKSFFLSVGTVEPRKNLLRLFEAHRIGRAEGRFDWPLVVVGARGWKSEKEHEVLRGMCNDGLASYLDYVGDGLLHKLYASAGGLVFPSLYEGFGLPVIEAMACGCPVLTSQGTAMEEFADHQAIFCDPLDVEALSFGMQALSSGHGVDGGRGYRVSRSWVDVALDTVAIYEKLVSA